MYEIVFNIVSPPSDQNSKVVKLRTKFTPDELGILLNNKLAILLNNKVKFK